MQIDDAVMQVFDNMCERGTSAVEFLHFTKVHSKPLSNCCFIFFIDIWLVTKQHR